MEYVKEPRKRPTFPKRAIVTAGMPYGNKELHFGHIGGVFVHADTFARFLRDRIGEDNVIFVSGTDCYGSPILEGYRKAKEAGTFTGTIEDYVRKNHEAQKDTLNKYEISLNLFAASALGRAGEIHKEVSKEIFEGLYEKGTLEKLSSPQFYDPKFKCLLNGRQVIGRCPIQGCQSEKAYADECDLGHQYMPTELIDPHSTLSGLTPELVDVTNWYYKLEDCIPMMQAYVDDLRKNSNARKFMLTTIEEFLKPPYIYVQKKFVEDLDALRAKFPEHEVIDDNKNSYTFVFKNLDDRDAARNVLDSMEINYRTGKTLVPFRLSGNIEWGVPFPEKEGLKDLTFWVWPESLWAPISFSRTYLESKGADADEWKKYWNSDDATVYQFIGQDNISFYGIAQQAMWETLGLKKTFLVPNNHILFMNKKASSSGSIKPPMAKDLLEFYTAEQMRMHFLSLGLANKSVSFDPQVYLPEEERQGADPVLKDGNLLTNVFNRIVRSCFYTLQKHFDGHYKDVPVTESFVEECKEAILTYEQNMYDHQFHKITYVLDTLIRNINKNWVNSMRTADANDDNELRAQVLADTFYGVRVATALLHPIAPSGCEKVRDYLNVDKRLYSWDHIFEPLTALMDDPATHTFKFLEPRVDFFELHPSQLAAKEQNQ
ncbi:MAG: class I tRNA ligase family protein [Paludibacteraceae bacterium]|nr:class I tRNA ligase family protein [Paludibacteraceae bacterium]